MKLTRAKYEALVDQCQAFVRLQATDDYKKTVGAWLEEKHAEKPVINILETPFNAVHEKYWTLAGQVAVIAELDEQMSLWEKCATLAIEQVEIIEDSPAH